MLYIVLKYFIYSGKLKDGQSGSQSMFGAGAAAGGGYHGSYGGSFNAATAAVVAAQGAQYVAAFGSSGFTGVANAVPSAAGFISSHQVGVNKSSAVISNATGVISIMGCVFFF